MALFRKKPVVIEAIRYTGNPGGDYFALKDFGAPVKALQASLDLKIETLEDGNGQVDHIATFGDWIIKGVNGEFYPCKPDIFDKTYEAVE